MISVGRHNTLAPIGALSFYLLMAFGGFFQFFAELVFFPLGIFLVLVATVLFNLLGRIDYYPWFVVCVLFVFSVFLLVGVFRSNDPIYAFQKYDSFVIVTIIAFSISIKLILDFGHSKFWRTYLFVSFVVLVITVFFKIKFGFMDRSVRFFINGPIVFGWLMGFSALVAYYNYLVSRNIFLLIATGLFSLAVVWSFSKGPLLALSIVFLYFSISESNGRRLLLYLAGVACLVGLLFFDMLWSSFLDSRFSAILRLAHSDVASTDWGSVGIRQSMVSDSLEKILKNPLLGIGLGNYGYDMFFYPHNEHLEVFLELGVFAGFFHVFAVAWMFFKSNSEYRGYLIFFIVCTSFSGDMGYLRFVYVIGFLGVFCTRYCRLPNSLFGIKFTRLIS